MKYALIIPDGAGDDPLEALGGRTPIEAARTPYMDEIARTGVSGTARTVPEGFESGSDVATLSLLGYDPAIYHTGRAPLEAAAQRIALLPSDWVFRCNLVTVVDGVMKDHSAGGISDADARTLITSLAEAIRETGFTFYPGVSYRNLLVYRGERSFDLKTKPPHEMLDEPTEKYLPSGAGADVLNRIMTQSQSVLANSPVCPAATQTWLWGQGHAPALETFAERFGIQRGAMITGVDLLRGIATLLGWDSLTVPGMTSFHDTDYARQGRATCDALDQYDIVVSHIESPDEASHQGDVKTKVAAIEGIDHHVVGPVLKKLRTFPQWRILVLPDHPTNIATRKHGYSPTAFAMAGTGLYASGATVFSEQQARHGKTLIGHELMPAFLHTSPDTATWNPLP